MEGSLNRPRHSSAHTALADKWLWILVAGVLLATLFAGYRVALRPFIQLSIRTHEPEMIRLMDAVENRVDPDPSIPSASYGLQFRNARDGEPGGYWFAIEISYTGACDSTPRDPCLTVVNELGRIVFDNYSRVDDLAGMDILITDRPDVTTTHLLDSIRFQKMLSIAEWRDTLH